MNQKAFFLDRDGTLNVDYNFVHTKDEWAWCRDAVDALKIIQDCDFRIIIVTNQSGIARDRYTKAQVDKLHSWVERQLAEKSIKIDGWYMAPHHPEFDTAPHTWPPEDRKPGTGMFQKAARRFDIDFSNSFMAGDKISDLKPAVKLGMSPLFIRSRHEPQQDKQWLQEHNIPIYDTLFEAVKEKLYV
jgi:D-glycero-D-manno-heptose 1,7-bisphosphate phosphatase